MRTLTATFITVTPMFIGDAYKNATNIRPPSIKGALRFWWRALNWKNAIEKHPDSEDRALAWLHSEEARLFGSAVDEGKGGQGLFSLTVTMQPPVPKYAEKQAFTKKNNPGIDYLLGQGLWQFKKNLTRNALKENIRFHLKIAFLPKAAASDIASVLEALQIFGLLGGLGSRARRGFGSITLEKVEYTNIDPDTIPQIPKDLNAYKTILQKALKGSNTLEKLPPLSAFSKQTEVVCVKQANDIFKLLDDVGKELQLYRSWGRNGRVNGVPAEKNFKEDHDNVANFTLKHPPKRVVFGLPHNYFFSSSGKQVEINAYHKNTEARRASPLLLHIHKLKENQFIAVHILMKSLFLPDEKDVYIKTIDKKTSKEKKLPPIVDYKVIETYLDRYTDTMRIL